MICVRENFSAHLVLASAVKGKTANGFKVEHNSFWRLYILLNFSHPPKKTEADLLGRLLFCYISENEVADIQ